MVFFFFSRLPTIQDPDSPNNTISSHRSTPLSAKLTRHSPRVSPTHATRTTLEFSPVLCCRDRHRAGIIFDTTLVPLSLRRINWMFLCLESCFTSFLSRSLSSQTPGLNLLCGTCPKLSRSTWAERNYHSRSMETANRLLWSRPPTSSQR